AGCCRQHSPRPRGTSALRPTGPAASGDHGSSGVSSGKRREGAHRKGDAKHLRRPRSDARGRLRAARDCGARGIRLWAQVPMAKPPRTELKLVGPDLETRFYLRRALERTGAVLVLGAADGRLPLELAARGRTVVGVEPSPMLRELARERLAAAGERLDARVRLVADDPRT